MARLVVESGVDGGMIFPLSEPRTTLGRSVSNSIQIIDRKVSRRHSEIQFRDGSYVFKDLGSKNGSFIDGNIIKNEQKLDNGNKIKIGETVLVFESGPEDLASGSDASSSMSVRIVDKLEWGTARESLAAGQETPLKLDLKAVEEKTLKDSHEKLAILYQVAEAIRNILNLDELLDQIMNIIFTVIEPDRGLIMLYDDNTNELIPKTVKKRIEDDQDIIVSNTIVDQCLRDRISVVVSDAASDQRFSGSESIIMNKIRSAICAPLIYKEEILGVLYVDTQSRVSSYGEEELELLTGIANQSAMAIANAKLHSRLVEQHKLAKELEIARTIQMNLLPKVYPLVENLDISAMSLPAKKVGGDYYDFIDLSQGRYGIVIADVSGKGVAAAILLATIRASLLIEAKKENATVTSVVTQLNQMACRDATNNMFITMVYGIIDPVNKQFEFTNAGHTYPLLFETSDKVTSLKTGGCFLGVMENTEYKFKKIPIKPWQTYVFYSDGVTDTMNSSGELFGLERLKDVIRAHLHCSAQEIRDNVYQACLDFRGTADQFDDFTLVIMKVI
ncbi:SpoIIE family protein phosphatase [Candidatus Sumerlaeota bacterium]|nr:SpoIIE family protein phosphatase [Candidatus Sumerlaeota bacterium]